MRSRGKRARDAVNANDTEASNDGPPLTQTGPLPSQHNGSGGRRVEGLTPLVVSSVLAQACRLLGGAFRTDFPRGVTESDVLSAVTNPHNLLFYENKTHADIYRKLQSSISLSSSLGHRSCHCLWGPCGSGKRRLLQLVGASLTSKQNYIVMHFDGDVIHNDDDAVRCIVAAVRTFVASDEASRELRLRHSALLKLGLEPTLGELVALGEWFEEYTMLSEAYGDTSGVGNSKLNSTKPNTKSSSKQPVVHHKHVDGDSTTMEGASEVLLEQAALRAAKDELLAFRRKRVLNRHHSILHRHTKGWFADAASMVSEDPLSAAALGSLRHTSTRPEDDPLGDAGDALHNDEEANVPEGQQSDAEGSDDDGDGSDEEMEVLAQKAHKQAAATGPASSTLSRALSRLQSALLYLNSIGVNLIVLIDNMSRFGRVADRVTYILSGLMHEQRQQASFALSARLDKTTTMPGVAGAVVEEGEKDENTTGGVCFLVTSITPEVTLEKRLSSRLSCEMWMCPPLVLPPLITLTLLFSGANLPQALTTPAPTSHRPINARKPSDQPAMSPDQVAVLSDVPMGWPVGVEGCLPSRLSPSCAFPDGCYPLRDAHLKASPAMQFSALATCNVIASIHWRLHLLEAEFVKLYECAELTRLSKEKSQKVPANKRGKKSVTPSAGKGGRKAPIPKPPSWSDLATHLPRRSFDDLFRAGLLTADLSPRIACLMDDLRCQLSVAELLATSMFKNSYGEAAATGPSDRSQMLLGAPRKTVTNSPSNPTPQATFCNWDYRDLRRVRESLKPLLQRLMQASVVHKVIGADVDRSRWVLSEMLSGSLRSALEPHLDLQDSLTVGTGPRAPAGVAMLRAARLGVASASPSLMHAGAFTPNSFVGNGDIICGQFLPMTVQGSVQGGVRDALDSTSLVRNGFFGVEHILLLSTLYIRLDSGQQRSVTDLIDDTRNTFYTNNSSALGPQNSSRTMAALVAALSQLLSWHLVSVYRGGSTSGVGAVGLKQGATGAKHAIGDVVVLGPLPRLHAFLRSVVDSPDLCVLAGLDAVRQGTLSSMIR